MRFLPFLLPCKGQPFPPERSSRTFQGVLQFRLPPLGSLPHFLRLCVSKL